MKPGNIESEVLRSLRAGPLSSVQLSQRLGRTRQGVFNCLEKLAESGVVEPVEDPSDRRSVYWRLKAS